MNAEQLAGILGGAKRHGTGYMARCPAHEDGKSSLSLRDGDKGILFHCHAGCDKRDVMAALALAAGGADQLFAEPRPARTARTERRIVATYDYVSEHGELLFQAVRFDPKDFRQRRPTSNGWDWKLGDTPIVPFRLPELIKADPERAVFVVEGEKDVEALRAIGCIATCNPMGAGKWREHFARWFKGRKVIILPDNDEPGRRHAAQVWHNLAPVVAKIRLIELPGLTEHGDVSDWLAAGGTREALHSLVRAAMAADQEPPAIPAAAPAPKPAPRAAQAAPAPSSGAPAAAAAAVVDLDAARRKREQTRGGAGDVPWSGRSWANDMIVGDSGKIKPLLANAITALRMDAEWQGCLAFDEFQMAIVVRRDTPSGTRAGAQWGDADDIGVCCWLQKVGIHVRDNDAAKAVNAIARESTFHPVRDYLRGLAHDGRSRIDTWLTEYCKAADTPLVRAFARRWLIGAVARVMRPGCQLDTALAFESDQGDNKSTAWRTLAGEWFTDDLEKMGGRESALQTPGVWIIEIAELAAMNRAEVENVKAFITRREDRVRAPYDRRPQRHARQCAFAATVNPDGAGWLRDPTGGRRFWPVAVGSIDVARLAADRDQLWAEARAAFESGERWWIDKQAEPELWKLSQDAQEERRSVDAWESIIGRYITQQPRWTRDGCDWTPRIAPIAEVGVGELLEHAFGVEPGKWNRADQMRVSQCLTALGWERFRGERDGKRPWLYRKRMDGRDGVGSEKPMQNHIHTKPSIPSQPKKNIDDTIPF